MSLSSRIKIGALVAVVSILIVVASGNAQFGLFSNPLERKLAPDFTLSSVRGAQSSLSQIIQGSNGAIVFFWATWCPHCREQIAELNAQAEAIHQKGIQIVLVDVGESSRDVAAYLAQHNMSFDVLLDSDTSVAQAYGVVGVPTFIFIKPDGVVSAVKHFLPDNYQPLFK